MTPQHNAISDLSVQCGEIVLTPVESININDEDLPTSELMVIQVTVYSLSGIVCSVKNHQCIKRMSNQIDITSPIEVFSPCQSDDLQSPLVPVTAVVSIENEKVRTFVPSNEIQTQKEIIKNNQIICYSAFWRDDGGAGLRRVVGLNDDDEIINPDFEILRDMKREPYRPDKKVGQISHYISERIDLDIAVSKGREIKSLGVASLAVSGDEDCEILMNVPVTAHKTLPSTQRTDRWKSKANNKSQRSFSNDRSLFYLEENSTLRLGIRIFPQYMKNDISKRGRNFYLECDSMRSFEQQQIAIEIDEENSLIVPWREESNDKELYSDNGELFSEYPGSNSNDYNTFSFCNAFPLCFEIHGQKKLTPRETMQVTRYTQSHFN